MSQIETVGTYLGEIVESGLQTTKKGFPQWVSRLKVDKKYVEDPSEKKHFGIEEPAYIDYSSFGMDTVAFLCLFKDAASFSADTALLNYEQLQAATGWDGTSFEPLTNGSFIGKKILFRVAEHTYEGKTSLQVAWIDEPNASPERQLKVLDDAAVKALSAKIMKKPITKPAAAPSKPNPTPAAGAPSPTTPAPAAPAPVGAPAGSPAAPTAPKGKKKTPPTAAAPLPPAPPVTSTPPAAPLPPPPSASDAAVPGLPAECTQTEAWEYVNSKKGGNEDQVVADAWIAACGEVGGQRTEDTFTAADWAKIRDVVLKDIAA